MGGGLRKPARSAAATAAAGSGQASGSAGDAAGDGGGLVALPLVAKRAFYSSKRPPPVSAVVALTDEQLDAEEERQAQRCVKQERPTTEACVSQCLRAD